LQDSAESQAETRLALFFVSSTAHTGLEAEAADPGSYLHSGYFLPGRILCLQQEGIFFVIDDPFTTP
jgi:hypothetical protein